MSVVNAVAENKIVCKADSTKALGTHPSNTSLLPEPKPQTQALKTRVQRQRHTKQNAVCSPETDHLIQNLMSRHFSNGEDEVKFFLSNAAIL